jgi:hypothetical protein
VTCDGGVLENTVWTPNHQYVASDVQLSQPRVGTRHEDRPRQPSPQTWLFPDTFAEYDTQVDTEHGAVTYGYPQDRAEPAPVPLTDAAFADACRRDRAVRAAGGPGLFWRPESAPAAPFRKRIRLAGRRLEVRYEGAPAGHVVGNEFSLDVRAALATGDFQERKVDPGGGSWTLEGPGDSRVSVSVDSGCAFGATAMLADLDEASARGMAGDYLRLHRVLTDAVEIVCPAGGDFEYHVDLD